MEPLRECELPDTTTVLQRLWAVMSDHHAVEQEKRQLILLETFLSVVGDRIKLSDLQLVSMVLEVIARKAEVKSEYKQNFQSMLDLLKAPLKMEKSSDQLNYHHHLVEFFTNLGHILLWTSIKEVKTQLLDIVLRILLTRRTGVPDMVPRKSCIRAVELSEFTESLADFIAISDKDNFSMAIFTALEICLMSKLCCWTLLMKDIIESVLVRLTLVHEEEVADSIYHLLWTLFSCTNRSEDWEKIPDPSRLALRSLRYVLREQAMIHGHPGRNPSVLHNIAALTLKIITLFPNADFVRSGLIEDITVSATLSEAVLEIHIIPFFKNKADHLQFKKLMLACLAISPVSSMSVEVFERYKLAECLVAMLNIDVSRSEGSYCTDTTTITSVSERTSSTMKPQKSLTSLDPEECIGLFRSAIPVVCVLFDSLNQRFIEAGLITTLTKVLSVYYLQDKAPPDDLSHMVVKTLLHICFNKRNPVGVKTHLRESGTVLILLQLCNAIFESGFSLTIRLQSILWHSLLILTALMENQIELQNEQSEVSLEVVEHLYRRILQPLPTDSVIDNRLVVAVSNFAWEVIVKNEHNLVHFINSDGIYSHIDILERSPPSTQLVYLSMLADISEYHKSVPYLVSWRGPKGIKLLSLLCNIWRTEEERLRVPRSESGCITDIERPLMGDGQFRFSKKEDNKYVSVYDIFGSTRPKIYALVQLLHRHSEVTQLCEEHYKLGYDKLPWEDQITLQVVEAYLPLKLGEVWWEIRHKQEGVLPLDRHLAHTLANRYLDWSLKVQRAQHSILRQREDVLKDREQQYYSQVRSVLLTKALEALREVTAIARTADRQVLLRSHLRLREGIEASRPPVDSDLHVAFPRDVRILLVNSKADVALRNEPD